MRYFILLVVVLSLISVYWGSFGGSTHAGAVYDPQLWGDFPNGNFWQVFAVFFSAVTGVLAGVNLSGTLENPRHNIPIGTMTAIVVSFIIYVSLAY